jgi:hypothetical protein
VARWRSSDPAEQGLKAVAQPGFDVVQSIQAVAIGTVQMLYGYAYALFDGVTTATLEVSLPRNAVVDDFKVAVRAQRVDSTKVQEVAQVRSYASSAGNELVIDFGTPRTVSGIDLPTGANVLTVYSWLGSQFSPQPAFGTSVGPPTPNSGATFAELRTERLRVVMSRALSAAELAEVRLRLPEPPSGLEIRIDDGAPVWSHPEPVQPRMTVTALDDDGWNSESRRIVPLTDALAALTGDPLAADDAVVFKLTLTTKVPCLLALVVHGTPQLRRIRRVRFGSDTATPLDFAGEGALELPLVLPEPPAGPARRIDKLSWVATADLPPWRALPPVGPDAALGSDGAALAELLVDAQRAVCVRLSGRGGLAELTAVRLPLRSLGDGAEARVVLWSVAEESAEGSLPLAPMPQGASEPVTLAASQAEQWVSFSFTKPVAVESGRMPWLALNVSRGELAWALGRASGVAGDPLDDQAIRRGPPNGPWKALPAPLQNSAGLLDARARLRCVGLAPKAAPLAPMTLALVGAAPLDLNPTVKGAAGELAPLPALLAAQPVLRLVSRTAGSLQLRDVDVISST